jgi:23S rRNA (uracil1939-C5)-methyltransferase
MQASEASERWMQSWVREQWGAVGCPKDLLDLYAGLGTLSLPLLGEGVHLRTVEGSLPSVTALLHARWDEVHGGARPLGWGHRRHEHHDLHRGVMPESWLDAARMAIVNPPRTGGTAAYRALAKARVPSIVSVTCHLPSWERDVRMLVEAGYRMASVACVDQFLWSGHSEWMTLFVLPGATMPCPMAQ